jgi:signal transduction histidine kinase
LISVHLDNRFWGDLTFENGVPKSSKGDKDYHGFGIRSMKYISKKYNGEFSINVSDHVFNLNVLLPIPPSSPAGCGNENAK